MKRQLCFGESRIAASSRAAQSQAVATGAETAPRKNLKSALLTLLSGLLLSAWPPGSLAQSLSFVGAARSVNFGDVNICAAEQTTPAPCSETLTLTYNVTSSGSLGAVKALTLGVPNMDFTLDTGGTCTGEVTSGTTCAVNVKFAPLYAGGRMGATQLTDASGNVLATTYLRGNGVGPQIAFVPGTWVTKNSSGIKGFDFNTINGPVSVAVDAAGNSIVVLSNSTVVKLPADGGPAIKVHAHDLIYPNGVALDGAGNIFISDFANCRVVEVPADGGAQVTVWSSSCGGPRNLTFGVAVDGLGNIFIAVANYVPPIIRHVVEIPAGGGAPINVGSDLDNPRGVAADVAGNLFISDTNHNRVVKVPVGGGAQTTVLDHVLNPVDLVVDSVGNLFVVVFGDGSIYFVEVPAGGGPPITLTRGINNLSGVAVDEKDNVFLASPWYTTLIELNRSQSPMLSFAGAEVGKISSDSPRSIRIENVGNQPLNALVPGLSIGANFKQVAGTGKPEDCTDSFSLASGASCSLSISFAPTETGWIQSETVLTDDSLNDTPATQSIPLTGIGEYTGTIATQTTLNSSVNPSLPGQPVQFAAKVTAASGATPTGTVIFKHSQTEFAMEPLVGGVASITIPWLNVAFNHPMTATYTGSATDAPSVSPVLVQAVLVGTTTTLTTSPNPSVAGQTVTFTARVVANTPAAKPTGTVHLMNGTTVIGTFVMVKGVYTIVDNQLRVAGSFPLTAVYDGYATRGDLPSTSAVLTQVVNP